MPVIDLNTGEIVEQPQEQEQQPQDVQTTQQPANEVINLETGSVEQVKPAPTPDDFVLADQDASVLQGMTPEEAAQLPEMGYLENKLLLSGKVGDSFKLALGALVSSDPAQQIEIIQNVLPDADVKTLESGETVVNYQGEKFILNKPGVSATDVTRFAGQFLAFLPVGKFSEFGREAVKKTAVVKALRPIAESAGKQRLAQVAAAATASAGISAGLDVSASGMAGEQSTQGVSGERALLSGVFGGGAELIGPAFRGIMRKFRGTPDDLKYIDLDSVAQLKQAEEATGIKLFEPQATQARSDSMYMRVLQDLPESQQQMAALLMQQNEDAAAAVTNYLASIADKKAIITAPKQVRDMAVTAIDDMKQARSNLVRQGYQEAFAEGTMVDIQPTVAIIDDMLSRMSSSSENPIRRELLRYKSLIESDAVDGKNGLEILHNVKMQLDDAIEGSAMETGLQRTVLGNLREIRTILRGAMEEASPAYDNVKTIYKDATGPIRELENSLIGKIAGIKDDNLKRVLTTMFDASQSNPAVLANAREIIKSQSPEAWDSLVRAHLESQLGRISTRSVEGVQNLPAMFRDALFGKNEVQRQMIMDSLTPEQKGNARWLEMALKAAARGRKAGSDTAGKTAAIADLKGSASWMEYFSPLNWSKNLSDAARQAKYERRVGALVDAMTNGEWSAEMAKLKELNPTDSASGRALVQLLARIESQGVDSEPNMEFTMPEAQQ